MRILFLDDERNPEQVLGKDHPHEVVVTRTVRKAIEAIETNPPFDCWHLDHDLGVSRGSATLSSGMDFLKLAIHYPGKWPKGCVQVHSANPCGRENMLAFIRSYEKVVLDDD